MMLNFEVYYDYGDYEGGKSKVYAIDTISHRFLIVTNSGYFKWVLTEDCEIVKEDD